MHDTTTISVFGGIVFVYFISDHVTVAYRSIGLNGARIHRLRWLFFHSKATTFRDHDIGKSGGEKSNEVTQVCACVVELEL